MASVIRVRHVKEVPMIDSNKAVKKTIGYETDTPSCSNCDSYAKTTNYHVVRPKTQPGPALVDVHTVHTHCTRFLIKTSPSSCCDFWHHAHKNEVLR